MSYNFGAEVGSRSWPGAGENRISWRGGKGRMQQTEFNTMKRNNQIGLYRQIQQVYIQEVFGDTGQSRNRYRRRGGGAIEET